MPASTSCSAAAHSQILGVLLLQSESADLDILFANPRFLLGNLHDFDPAANGVPYDALPATDRFLLATFGSLLSTLATSYENYQFYRVYQVRPAP